MRNRRGRRPIAVIMAVALAVILSLPSLGTISAFADESSQTSSQTEQSGTDQSGSSGSGSSGTAATSGSGVSGSSSSDKSGTTASTTDEETTGQDVSGSGTEDNTGTAAKNGGTADYDESDIGELKLVYGNSSLPDDDAFVLLIFGDGFTSSQQTDFYKEATNTADYIMETSPYDEFKDEIKIYALGTASKDSGAKGAKAQTKEEADADTTDTFFGTRYWLYGMQRLLGLEDDSEGVQLVKTLQQKYLPAADFSMMIVNSDVYGGSGGDICVASLNSKAREIMMHEMGHTVGGLADEYWAGASYADETKPNMTQESDPAKVKWSRFVGKNGVGVYEYTDGGDGWYHPSQSCKMQYLGKEYGFCEVCKEELRKSISQKSNVTKLFFQTYADEFHESDAGTDMSQYFIIRKGKNETTGDKLGSALKLTYKDSNGNTVDGIPSKQGTYTVTAAFSGNDTYDAATQTGTYTIGPADIVTVTAEDKVYDGHPEDVSIVVNYDKEYTAKLHFTGKIPYTDSATESYDSDQPPTKPGKYTVTATAYDKGTGDIIGEKARDFQISFKTTQLVNNDDPNTYWGAASYYNNKQIVITGEGFTADQQDEFEELAKEYTDYILSTEPYKEAKVYFDFTTVEAESNESGIGLEGVGARDTYFQLTRDSLGKVVPNTQATDAAKYIGGKVVTAYYKNVIVIVNDDSVKEGAEDGRVIYVGKGENSKKYASRVLLNKLTGKTADYQATTDEEKAAQRLALLNNIYMEWWGGHYATIVSRAYDEKFVENGTSYDLAPYFHVYVGDKEVPQDKVKLILTYYSDNNGQVGEKLDSAPSGAGTYHVRAEILPPDGQDYSEVVVDANTTYYIPPARGWTTYTIQPAESTGGNGSGTTTVKTTKTTKTVTVKGVRTGDEGRLMIYAAVLTCAAAACAGMIRRRNRIRRNG